MGPKRLDSGSPVDCLATGENNFSCLQCYKDEINCVIKYSTAIQKVVYQHFAFCQE